MAGYRQRTIQLTQSTRRCENVGWGGILAAAFAGCLLGVGCGDDTQANETGGAGGMGGSGAGGATSLTTFGGDRPVELFVPSSYNESQPMPLVILLHGFGVSGMLQEILFKFEPLAEARGFLYAHPDGTVNGDGQRFWNATDLCCDFEGSDVDDVGYLLGLIDEISERYNVDPRRVYFSGHSNGHFMSYRMACEHSDRIAGIAGLAGATFADDEACEAQTPVNILHVHGTDDSDVPYEAGPLSTSLWAARNGCDDTPEAGPDLDLESSIEGDETTVERYTGCPTDGEVELWSMQGATHLPNFSTSYAPALVDWLLDHPGGSK